MTLMQNAKMDLHVERITAEQVGLVVTTAVTHLHVTQPLLDGIVAIQVSSVTKALEIAILMMTVPLVWFVEQITVGQIGQVDTIVASKKLVIQTTLTWIAVPLPLLVERELETAILMQNVRMDWSVELIIADQIGLKVMTAA